METLYAIYKHEPVQMGSLIVYNHLLLEVMEKSFTSGREAEAHIKELPAGEYVVMPYFKKM